METGEVRTTTSSTSGDRWHLLRHMSEALRNALEPHRRTMLQAAKAVQQNSFVETLNPVMVPADPVETLTVRREKRHRRHGLYEQMRVWWKAV